MDPTEKNYFFFYYETLIYVIAVKLNRNTLLNSVKFAKKLAVMKKWKFPNKNQIYKTRILN
jgi:hypothetical protein